MLFEFQNDNVIGQYKYKYKRLIRLQIVIKFRDDVIRIGNVGSVNVLN